MSTHPRVAWDVREPVCVSTHASLCVACLGPGCPSARTALSSGEAGACSTPRNRNRTRCDSGDNAVGNQERAVLDNRWRRESLRQTGRLAASSVFARSTEGRSCWRRGRRFPCWRPGVRGAPHCERHSFVPAGARPPSCDTSHDVEWCSGSVVLKRAASSCRSPCARRRAPSDCLTADPAWV